MLAGIRRAAYDVVVRRCCFAKEAGSMTPRHVSMMPRVRQFVRADFVIAVIITVLYPLYFLGRAVLLTKHRHTLRGMLAYWRVASLLMVSVYLVAGGRNDRMLVGALARLAMLRALYQLPSDDAVWQRWRWVGMAYCLGGVSAQLATIADTTVHAEYVAATRVFTDTMHPQRTAHELARWGQVGLGAWLMVWVLESCIKNPASDS
jgi:hypothetical protein